MSKYGSEQMNNMYDKGFEDGYDQALGAIRDLMRHIDSDDIKDYIDSIDKLKRRKDHECR